MNLKLLLVMLPLSLLVGCAHSVRDDSPASDLDVLVANVKRLGTPTLLANGKQYCAELSHTQAELDECTGDLEDAVLSSNGDKAAMVRVVVRFADRERLRRNPCGWFERLRRADRCAITP